MKKWLVIFWSFIQLSISVTSQNAPVTAVGNLSTLGSEITIPITARDFMNIASCNLELQYNANIATCISVSTGPSLGGNMNTNLEFPGRILIGWYAYPGVTLEDSTVIFTLTFEKADTGTSSITWYDDGYSCIYYDGNSTPLNDIPAQEYYINGSLTFLPAIAPDLTILQVSGCNGDSVGVPVIVDRFNNVGKFKVTLHYNPSSILFRSFTGISFPDMTLDNEGNGKIILQGISDDNQGISLPDSSTLVILSFTIIGETTQLGFDDADTLCFFEGPSPDYFLLDDTPFSLHYLGCMISEIPEPGAAGEIKGPPNGHVYQGEKDVMLTVDSIPGASLYEWYLPQGIVLSDGDQTSSIRVSVGSEFRNGFVTVKGYNACGAGADSPGFFLVDTTSLGFCDKNDDHLENDLRIEQVRLTSRGEDLELYYYLPEDGTVCIEIFALSGEKERGLITRWENKGIGTRIFSAMGLKNTIHIVKIRLKTDKRYLTCSEKVFILHE
jgi:hypothetical protein